LGPLLCSHPQIEEIDQPRAPRRARDAGELPAAGERIEGARLADVAAAAEGELGRARRRASFRPARACDGLCGEYDHLRGRPRSTQSASNSRPKASALRCEAPPRASLPSRTCAQMRLREVENAMP